MDATRWEGATRAALFVRSDLPTPAKECRQRTIARLEDLVTSGALGEFSVTSWAKRVPVDDDSALGPFERDRYDEFSSWARGAGVRLAPFFATRECYSSTTGDRQTQLVLPAVCLALYDGDDLVAVAPHAHESGTVSVTDCLDRLGVLSEENPEDDRTVTMTAD